MVPGLIFGDDVELLHCVAKALVEAALPRRM